MIGTKSPVFVGVSDSPLGALPSAGMGGHATLCNQTLCRGAIRCIQNGRSLTIASMLACILVPMTPALSQEYPSRSVRMIVPFPPGGGTDIVARSLSQKMTDNLKQSVLVDNRPGAGGSLGAELAVRAAPDGYTILMVSASYAVNASLYKLAFDPVKDLAAVTQVATLPAVLVVHASVPANNIKTLIALAQARPGQLNYASSGNGSSPHLAGQLFTIMTRTSMIHVPYKGGGPAIADLVGGQVQVMFSTVVQALPHIKSGKLKALAVSSLNRISALPEVPTIDESGVPGYDETNWLGVLVPKATPRPVVDRLHKEIVQHLSSPDLKSRLSAEGAEAVGSRPAEFERKIASDVEKYTRIVKESGIKID